MTRAEERFHRAVRETGCVACFIDLGVESSCEIHHILSGGRRIGEWFVLGLCALHHRSGRNDAECVSRHPWHRAFEARYGSEPSLLRITRQLVVARNLYEPDELPVIELGPSPEPAVKFCTACRREKPGVGFVKVNRYREICADCDESRDAYLRVQLRALSKPRHP